MTKNSSVRIAVAGCGYWGKNLVRNYAQLGALAAIVDADANLTAKLSKEFSAKALSWSEMLQDTNIQGVAIATPASSHYALAREALEAGKHVFVEKPLALKVEEAEALCEVSERVGRTLMVGHLLQYHPAFIELKRMVKAGDLGKLQYIYSNRLNFGKVRVEEDILWSFAPHDISMILALTGSDPYRVRAVGSYHLHESIADVTTTHLSFADGVRAHVFVSWLHPCKEQKLIAVGDGGMAVFDDTQPWESKLLFYPHKIDWCNGVPVAAKADMTPVKLVEDEPLKRECQHFIDCIASEERPRTDGYEGLRVLKVLDQAARSLSIELERSKPAKPKFMVHESAYVDDGAIIGEGTKIWHFSHILPRTTIGSNVVISQNVMAGPDVTIGDNCKIQNNVSLYKGVILERGVFCGPSCVFTNVNTPRAEVERKDEFLQTIVKEGATIGANATIVCGNELGAYCFIAAGAVVTSDVPAHALMAGVPARRIGWVSHTGEKLGKDLTCPRTGRKYKQISEHELVAEDENDTVYRFRSTKNAAG